MFVSTLISQCRRETGDNPKTTQSSRNGDGTSTIFNTGAFPIVEGSYTVKVGGTTKTETTHYSLDKDTGDIVFTSAAKPGNNTLAQIDFKYANWRDQNWLDAINNAIDSLNARGFFKQVVRNSSIFRISANVRVYNAPTACIDVYELLESGDYTTSGSANRLPYNWSYQQDGNKIILGTKPSIANRAFISYLRNIQKASVTSATLDTLDDWNDLVKAHAKAEYFRFMAGKIAQQANASVDEGHFSFSNLRTNAIDHENNFERLALRKKPTRPSKEIQFHIGTGGVA